MPLKYDAVILYSKIHTMVFCFAFGLICLIACWWFKALSNTLVYCAVFLNVVVRHKLYFTSTFGALRFFLSHFTSSLFSFNADFFSLSFSWQRWCVSFIYLITQVNNAVMKRWKICCDLPYIYMYIYELLNDPIYYRRLSVSNQTYNDI